MKYFNEGLERNSFFINPYVKQSSSRLWKKQLGPQSEKKLHYQSNIALSITWKGNSSQGMEYSISPILLKHNIIVYRWHWTTWHEPIMKHFHIVITQRILTQEMKNNSLYPFMNQSFKPKKRRVKSFLSCEEFTYIDSQGYLWVCNDHWLFTYPKCPLEFLFFI